jgi:hypothetical protein
MGFLAERRRLPAVTIAILAAMTVATIAFCSTPAVSQAAMTNFTGDWWWCKANESPNDSANTTYYVMAPYYVSHTTCVTSPTHSYGFASGTDVSVAAHDKQVCVQIGTPNLSQTYTGTSCSTAYIRVCIYGAYPNCNDADGYSARSETWNNHYFADNIRLKGHSLY